MSLVGESATHQRLMDGIYRRQRYIYDATRKFYLLGRDRLIRELAPPSKSAVLELGCGTGRNLALAAARYPATHFYGLDISKAMLETARKRLERDHIDDIVHLAEGDATAFDPQMLFDRAKFDSVFLSYAISMIPPWKQAITQGLDVLASGGSLYIVDFGRQEGLPRAFRWLLHRWLEAFHVSPRESLREFLESECEKRGASLSFESIFRGYAVIARITLPAH